MGASAPIIILPIIILTGTQRKTRVDHPSITNRRSSTIPQAAMRGAITIGSCRRSNPDNTARPPGGQRPAQDRRPSAPTGAPGCSTGSNRIAICALCGRGILAPGEHAPVSRHTVARRVVTGDATAPRSMSLANTRRRSSFAAAIDKIPVPAPMSSGSAKPPALGDRLSSAIKQPRVDGCSPVPKAVAAST